MARRARDEFVGSRRRARGRRRVVVQRDRCRRKAPKTTRWTWTRAASRPTRAYDAARAPRDAGHGRRGARRLDHDGVERVQPAREAVAGAARADPGQGRRARLRGPERARPLAAARAHGRARRRARRGARAVLRGPGDDRVPARARGRRHPAAPRPCERRCGRRGAGARRRRRRVRALHAARRAPARRRRAAAAAARRRAERATARGPSVRRHRRARGGRRGGASTCARWATRDWPC